MNKQTLEQKLSAVKELGQLPEVTRSIKIILIPYFSYALII